MTNELPGTRAVIDPAHAYAVLALVDEVAALRAVLQDVGNGTDDAKG